MCECVGWNMADLSKTGISTGEDIEATDVSNLYDALTGDTAYDNVYSNKGKVYRAILLQSGTNAPTAAAVLENTLGGTPSFAYSDVGLYTISLNGMFLVAKTLVFLGGVFGSCACEVDEDIIIATRNTAGNLANGILSSIPVEIIVYP